MGYSKLASMCAGCPNIAACSHKRMEACAAAELPAAMIDDGIRKSEAENPSVSVNIMVDRERTVLVKKMLNERFGISCLGGR